MQSKINENAVFFLEVVSEGLAIAVGALGIFVLLGWKLDIAFLKSVFPNLPVMAPNTAFALFLSGLALFSLQSSRMTKNTATIARISAAIIALFGLLTLLEYFLGINLKIDQIIIDSRPTFGSLIRMSPQSAINFFLIGLSLFFLSREKKPLENEAVKKSFSQFFIIAAGIISLITLLGHLHNITALYTVNPYKGMALHTAIAFICLFFGIFGARPTRGLMLPLVKIGVSAVVVRQLFFTFITLLIFDTLAPAGRKLGFYDYGYESILHSLIIIGGFIYLIFIAFRSLDKFELIETEKTATDELNNELQKLKLAVDNASDHIIISDSEGIIIYANKAAEKTTGYSSDELLGKKANVWGRQMDAEYYKKLWKTIKIRKEPFTGEVVNVRKNGEPYEAEIHIAPVIDKFGNIKYFVCIERDITEQKRTEKAKSEFISLASHQLRTPLTTVKWYAGYLLDGDAGTMTEKQIEFVRGIHSANNKMIDLVNSLLHMSRIELGTMQNAPIPTDITIIADSLLNDFTPQIKKKNLIIEKKFEKDLPMVNVDPNIIRIVLQNLFSNAIKYTPPAGKIIISIEKQILRLLITVSDTGFGIPKHQQDKIFTKLFRAENAQKREPDGSGLGLYISKSVLEQINGNVWFESIEDKGTTFYATIPLNNAKPEKTGQN